NGGQDCSRTARCKLVAASVARIKGVRGRVAGLQAERRYVRRRSHRRSDNLTVFDECNQTRRLTVLRSNHRRQDCTGAVAVTVGSREKDVGCVKIRSRYCHGGRCVHCAARCEDAVLIVDSEESVWARSKRRCTKG